MIGEYQGNSVPVHNYVAYLKFLDNKLETFFEMQKPYIFCKKGCAKCCKNAEFPYSFREIQYLLYGFLQLDDETKIKINNNLTKILKAKKDFLQSSFESNNNKDLNQQNEKSADGKKNTRKKFLYDCPFLINDSCSVYPYRGIVCRTFGLIANVEDENPKIPFCCFEGQNYSNVLDAEKNQLSSKKVEELGLEQEPVGFYISYEFLTHSDFEKKYNFEFGEKKSLIEWLE